jgi:hypothetical protein
VVIAALHDDSSANWITAMHKRTTAAAFERHLRLLATLQRLQT